MVWNNNFKMFFDLAIGIANVCAFRFRVDPKIFLFNPPEAIGISVRLALNVKGK